MKSFLATLSLLLWVLPTPAQIMFEKKYGGPGAEEGKCVVMTNDGGYMMCGYTNSNLTVNHAYLVKTDSLGDTLWTHGYGGANGESAYWICQNSDSGYTFVGSTSDYGAGTPAYTNTWVVRTDKNGDTLWTRSFDYLLKNDRGVFVMQTSDGGFLVLAYVTSSSTAQSMIYKLSPSGTLQWNDYYAVTNGAYLYYALEEPNGDLQVTGGFAGTTGWDGTVRRYDANGNYLSGKVYDLPGNIPENFFYIQKSVTSSGYYLAGVSDYYNDVYLVRTDANLDTVWTATISTFFVSGSLWNRNYSTQQTVDGGFIFAGYTSSGDNQVKLIKTDSLGNVQWTQYYGGPDADWGYCVRQTPDHGYIISGMADYQSASVIQAYLIKTDSLGNTSFTTGITQQQNSSGVIVYPNPSAGVINFSGLGEEPCEITIYNSIGEIVYQQNIFSNKAAIDLSGFPDGIYFLKFTSNNGGADYRKILVKK